MSYRLLLFFALTTVLLLLALGSWRLDFTVMQNLIRFGRDNSWHFVSGDIADSPYAFAFADWRLDRRGYPSN